MSTPSRQLGAQAFEVGAQPPDGAVGQDQRDPLADDGDAQQRVGHGSGSEKLLDDPEGGAEADDRREEAQPEIQGDQQDLAEAQHSAPHLRLRLVEGAGARVGGVVVGGGRRWPEVLPQPLQRHEPGVGNLVAHELRDPRMADAAFLGDSGPLAAPGLECGADFEVEMGVHSPIISKFCASNKQHFADAITQSIAMPQLSLNERLAHALDKLMKDRGLSNNELGKRAKVAPNTIANYRDTEPSFTSKGKPRSAQLAEVEKIAAALGLDALDLLDDKPDVAAAQAQQASLSPEELDLLESFRRIPEDEQRELVHDIMARAEQFQRSVQKELARRGMAISGYASATRAAETLPKAPAPPPNVVKLPGFGLDSPPAYTLVNTPWRLVESPVHPKKEGDE